METSTRQVRECNQTALFDSHHRNGSDAESVLVNPFCKMTLQAAYNTPIYSLTGATNGKIHQHVLPTLQYASQPLLIPDHSVTNWHRYAHGGCLLNRNGAQATEYNSIRYISRAFGTLGLKSLANVPNLTRPLEKGFGRLQFGLTFSSFCFSWFNSSCGNNDRKTGI